MIGVGGHFLHNDLFHPTTHNDSWRLERTLPFVKELGVKTVHEQIYPYTSPERILVSDGTTDPSLLAKMAEKRQLIDGWLGQYDAAGIRVVLQVQGIKNTATRGPANNAEFSAWVADLLSRHPCVTAVQLHNEPQLSSFGSWTPQQYVDVFKGYSAAIKAKAPNVRILGGAVSSLWWADGITWFKSCLSLGMMDWVDGIVVHPYSVDFPPETDNLWRGQPKTVPNHRELALRAYWDLVQTYNTTGKPLTLAFTEFGWNTAIQGQFRAPSEPAQADYLSRTFLIFLDSRLRDGVPITDAHWYDLKDDGTNDESLQHRFGLVDYNLTYRKPSFYALQSLAKYFVDLDDFEAIDLAVTPIVVHPTLKIKTWRRKSTGAHIVAFWNTDWLIAPCATASGFKLNIGLPNSGLVYQYYASNQARSGRTKTLVNGQIQVGVTLSARASWLQINPV